MPEARYYLYFVGLSVFWLCQYVAAALNSGAIGWTFFAAAAVMSFFRLANAVVYIEGKAAFYLTGKIFSLAQIFAPSVKI